MGLTISNLFTRLFGKKQMRILMGMFKHIFLLFKNKIKLIGSHLSVVELEMVHV